MLRLLPKSARAHTDKYIKPATRTQANWSRWRKCGSRTRRKASPSRLCERSRSYGSWIIRILSTYVKSSQTSRMLWTSERYVDFFLYVRLVAYELSEVYFTQCSFSINLVAGSTFPSLPFLPSLSVFSGVFARVPYKGVLCIFWWLPLWLWLSGVTVVGYSVARLS